MPLASCADPCGGDVQHRLIILREWIVVMVAASTPNVSDSVARTGTTALVVHDAAETTSMSPESVSVFINNGCIHI